MAFVKNIGLACVLVPLMASFSLFAAAHDHEDSPSLEITSESELPFGRIGEAYAYTLEADGGEAPYTWELISGQLPEGVNFDTASGQIHGGPVQLGTNFFRVQVTDAETNKVAKDFALVIKAPPNPPTIVSSSPLPSGMVGLNYKQMLQATGGVAPYQWSVTGTHSLPVGLNLGSTNGVLAGTPGVAGTVIFRIRVTGANDDYVEQDFSLTIDPTSPLPNLRPFQPDGWSDIIVVTTNTTSTTDAAVLYDDEDLYADCAVANESPTVKIPQKFYLKLYIDDRAVQEWPQNGLPASTILPTILGIGQLSAGTHRIRFDTDSRGSITEYNEADNSITKTIVVTAQTDRLTILSPSSLPDGTNGNPYNLTLTATNRGEVYYWSLYSGSLPPGLRFDTNSATISGIPTDEGTYHFQIKVMVPDGHHTEKELSLTINNPPMLANLTFYQPDGWSDKVVIATNATDFTEAAVKYDDQDLYLNWAVLNASTLTNIPQAFNYAFYVDDQVVRRWTSPNGLASYAWTAVKHYDLGKLTSGTHSIRVVADADNEVPESNKADNTYTKTIIVTPRFPAPAITSLSPLPPATNGVSYQVVLQAAGGVTPYTWSLATGSLPAGLTLDGTTGVVQGTPAAEGAFTFQLRVAGANNQTSEQEFSLIVNRYPLALGLNMYAGSFAGLLIAAPVGTTIEIQCSTNVSQSSNWVCLTNLALPTSTYLLIDNDSLQYPKRFYRAVVK